MAGKRFFTTEIWTHNKWFRRLSPNGKLFWFYLIGSCDNVGVWEEDLDYASYVTGIHITDESYKEFNGQIIRLSDKKIWLRDFCDFQYGLLEESTTSIPHKSYILLLKKHGLWYTLYQGLDNPLHTLKDKDKEKDKDKVLEEDKNTDMDKDYFDEHNTENYEN
jgi:hypothetical protein